jgi:hypothetical protein
MKTLGELARIDSRKAAKAVLVSSKAIQYGNVAHDFINALTIYRGRIERAERKAAV